MLTTVSGSVGGQLKAGFTVSYFNINYFIHRTNPSGRTMALGLTQPLTEMITRNTSWGVQAAGA